MTFRFVCASWLWIAIVSCGTYRREYCWPKKVEALNSIESAACWPDPLSDKTCRSLILGHIGKEAGGNFSYVEIITHLNDGVLGDVLLGHARSQPLQELRATTLRRSIIVIALDGGDLPIAAFRIADETAQPIRVQRRGARWLMDSWFKGDAHRLRINVEEIAPRFRELVAAKEKWY